MSSVGLWAPPLPGLQLLQRSIYDMICLHLCIYVQYIYIRAHTPISSHLYVYTYEGLSRVVPPRGGLEIGFQKVLPADLPAGASCEAMFRHTGWTRCNISVEKASWLSEGTETGSWHPCLQHLHGARAELPFCQRSFTLQASRTLQTVEFSPERISTARSFSKPLG